MKILTVLTYFRPHISGLTIYVERLAKALVEGGHEVTVLTSQFEPDLPREEMRDGVRIVRVPVVLRISKGVIMPTFPFLAWKLAAKHDVLHAHLPQFEAGGLALLGRLLRKPTVLTYHCDLELPSGIFNRIVNQVVHVMNYLAGMFTHRIGAYTEDFANHSPYLQRFAKKVKVILPPVALPEAAPGEVEAFQGEHNPESRGPIIGMATRFASEKGVEILLDALPKVLERYPNAMVLYAGQYQDVLGEDAYFERLFPTIQKYQANGQWKFLGIVDPSEMSAFYANLDVLVVPSLNSTETFGLVQIEAMMNGTPTVASNLPGVRQPPRMTGMGKVVPIGDAVALAEALIDIFDNPENYQGDPEAITRQFSPQSNAAGYVEMYRELGIR
ncbi:MAG: 2-deoxystreptamine N-acetyl-D-glucosaminyltransferase [Chloroflexi bacterium]|nr:2-deoxystreptamine N-acetyl-D-glucosaminyltransferase [Chloroflexota bacterium]